MADLGVICRLKRSKDGFSLISGSFWVDLGRIFDQLDVDFRIFDDLGRIFIDVGIALVDFERLLDEFGVDILPFSTYFRCDFEQISDIAFPIIVPSSHKHAKQETQQSHKPQICNLPRLHLATSPLWRTSGALLVHQAN